MPDYPPFPKIKHFRVHTDNQFKYAAAIIEPRKHQALRFVIENVHQHLGDEWAIFLFHGTKNEAYARDVLKEIPVTYVNIGMENLNAEQYNKYVMKETFWNAIPAEHILIFQTDSIMMQNTPHKIEEYLSYDYVGAPWKTVVGCGGFSLRRKSSALAIVRSLTPTLFQRWHKRGEDVFFARVLERHSCYKVAPVEIAKTFCVGMLFYSHPLATHKYWSPGLTSSEVHQLQAIHPETVQLIALQDQKSVLYYQKLSLECERRKLQKQAGEKTAVKRTAVKNLRQKRKVIFRRRIIQTKR